MLTEDPPIWLILVLAAAAGFILFQLYNVLGKRVGRQPSDDPAPEPALAGRGGTADAPARADLGPAAVGAAAIRQREPAFDPAEFVEGGRNAYTTIVRAFSAGDRETLRPLLSPPVMASFEGVMAQREAEDRSESVEFLHPPRADIEELDVVGDTGRARVRFLGELRTRSKGPEGEAVDDRRTAEVWTFERQLGAPDPNWILVRVEAAEA